MAMSSLVVILAIIVTIMSTADCLRISHRDHPSPQQIALGNTTALSCYLAGTPSVEPIAHWWRWLDRGVMVSFFSAQSIHFVGTFRRCGLLALGHALAAVLDWAGVLSGCWPLLLRPSFLLRVVIRATWSLLLDLWCNSYLAQHYMGGAKVEDGKVQGLDLKGVASRVGSYLTAERVMECFLVIWGITMIGGAFLVIVDIPMFGWKPNGLTAIKWIISGIALAFGYMAVMAHQNGGGSESERNTSSDGAAPARSQKQDVSKGPGERADKVAPPAAAAASKANRRKSGNKKKKRGTVW